MLPLLKINKNSKYMHICLWNISRKVCKTLLAEVASENNLVVRGMEIFFHHIALCPFIILYFVQKTKFLNFKNPYSLN